MKRGKVESVQKLWLNKDEAMAYLGCSVLITLINLGITPRFHLPKMEK